MRQTAFSRLAMRGLMVLVTLVLPSGLFAMEGKRSVKRPGEAATVSEAEALHQAPPIAPARNGDVAIREEFEAARRSDSAAAYQLFIMRHPDHPLSSAARKAINRLKKGEERNRF